MTDKIPEPPSFEYALWVAKDNQKRHRDFAREHKDKYGANHLHNGAANAYEVIAGVIEEALQAPDTIVIKREVLEGMKISDEEKELFIKGGASKVAIETRNAVINEILEINQ